MVTIFKKSQVLFFIILSVVACHKTEPNIFSEKELTYSLINQLTNLTDQEMQDIPFLKTRYLTQLSNKELEELNNAGARIWNKEDLFMRGITKYWIIDRINIQRSDAEIFYNLKTKNGTTQYSMIYSGE